MRGVAADLRRVRDLTEIKQVEKEDRMISEGTEDGERVGPAGDFLGLVTNSCVAVLKLDTLLKLSESTSYDLRAAYVFTDLTYIYTHSRRMQTDSWKGLCALSLNDPRRARLGTCY